MKAPKFVRLILIMACFFAAGHLLFAANLYFAQKDPAKVAKVETARQAVPFALDLGLLALLFFVSLMAANLKGRLIDEALGPRVRSRKVQFAVICFLLAVLLALFVWRTSAAPQIGPLTRRHVFMAVVFLLLGLYNKRHFSLTAEEEAHYGE